MDNLAKIADLERGRIVEVVGIVGNIQQPANGEEKENGERKRERLDFWIVDQTGKVRVALWEKEEQEQIQAMEVMIVVMKNSSVNVWKGSKSLNGGSFAKPTGGFAIELRAFRVGLMALPDNEGLYK